MLFPIFKRITIGGMATHELRRSLMRSNCLLSRVVSDLLDQMVLLPSHQTVNIVEVSLKDLGFIERVDYEDVYERAAMFGLSVCPEELGFYLRIQYLDQPKGDDVMIAMKPISIHSLQSVYVLQCDQNNNILLWTRGIPQPRHRGVWELESKFIFILPDNEVQEALLDIAA